ncbi:MAG: hypothetical protein IPN86_21090 [Saprospiraceae bacterium]|nr:hypothetical protein [Saprospiraceae bacterium]
MKISEPNDLDYYGLTFSNVGTIRIILGNINQTDKDFNIKLFKNDELVGLSENVHPIGDRIEFQVSDLSANYYILVYGANYNQWSCHDEIRLGIDWRPYLGSNPTDCSDIYEPNNGFGLASYFAGQNFGSVNYSGSIYPNINGNYDDPDFYKVVTNQWGTLISLSKILKMIWIYIFTMVIRN